MQALLIGYGSIGKRHLQQLEKRCERVFVIDPFQPDPVQINQKTRFFRSFIDFREAATSASNSSAIPDVAVIANWGPDHYASVAELQTFGIRKFLVEKPLASRYSDLEKLEYKIGNNEIQVWSNFHLRFDKTTNFLSDFVAENNLPAPSLMSVSGGAKCLATTGIHWIDYFLLFSQESKFDVQSRIKIEKINPRNKDLSFLEGFINLASKNTSLNLTFSNQSYSDASVDLYWKTFKIQICEGKFRLLKSYNQDMNLLPITRTHAFTELIFESDFGLSGFESLYDAFFESKISMDRLFLSNKYLLQSLMYSESLALLTRENFEKLTDKDYLIS